MAAHVAANPPRVLRDRGESRDAGEPVGAAVDTRVAAGVGDELGAEDGADAGHAQDDPGVRVVAKPAAAGRPAPHSLQATLGSRAGDGRAPSPVLTRPLCLSITCRAASHPSIAMSLGESRGSGLSEEGLERLAKVPERNGGASLSRPRAAIWAKPE